MSRGGTAVDAAVGMMDAAYFTGRKELLSFFNDLLDLNLTKIEETASGAVACQVTNLLFPGSIPMSKVNWAARSEYEFVTNYKLLQIAFTKHRVQRYVDVDKLIRAKHQDNLEFCQWLKAFFEQQFGRHLDDDNNNTYDPSAVRARGKGGVAYNAAMRQAKVGAKVGGGGGVAVAARSHIRAATAAAATPTNAKPIAAKVVTPPSTATAAERVRRILLEQAPTSVVVVAPSPLFTPPINHDDDPSRAADSVVGVMQAALEEVRLGLQNRIQELLTEIEDLELDLAEAEKVRNMYFEKLCRVERLLHMYQEMMGEEGELDASSSGIGEDVGFRLFFDSVVQILYATAEEGLPVSEDGQVVVVRWQPDDADNELLAD